MAKEKEEEKDELFDETLDAAHLFDDISKETGEAEKAKEDILADEYDFVPDEVKEDQAPAPVPEPPADESPTFETSEQHPSTPAADDTIGKLFQNVVKHSPISKIRLEEDSIGALFKKYIK